MIKAIETSYKGYRFRSRLEARWAIVLDTLGVRWEYEHEGFECSYRVSLAPGTYYYLPDFWLPDERCYLEVKGSLTDNEFLRVLDQAASLCDREETRLILAGPIPDPARPYAPTALSMRKGCLLVSPGLIRGKTIDGEFVSEEGKTCAPGRACVAHDVGGDLAQVTQEGLSHNSDDPQNTALRQWVADPLGRPLPWKNYADEWFSGRSKDDFARAYRAARSARFEHGQSGVR